MYQTSITNSANSAAQAKSFVSFQHDILAEEGHAHNADQLIIDQVFEHYRSVLKVQPRLARTLIDRKVDPDYIDHFQIGFADRTLGFELQSPKSLLGSQNRGHLQRLGLLKETGHEFFGGAMVTPFHNGEGQIVGAYGRRLQRQRRSPAYHLYWNAQQAPFFNTTGQRLPKSLILSKSAMDTMTLLTAGIENVVATMGIQGFNESQLERLIKDGVRHVFIAFDNTPSANHYALLVAQAIDTVGIQCHRINLPVGQDVNRFAMSHLDVVGEFTRLVDNAVPLKQDYGDLVSAETSPWLDQLMTIEDGIDFYLAEQRQAGRAFRTHNANRIHLGRFQEYCDSIQIEQIAELTEPVLESYQHHLAGERNVFTGKNISLTTQRERMEAVSRMLARLHYYGVISEPLSFTASYGVIH